ncbi:MAG: ATPase [Bacteroidetes bacterium]|nr:ATPase [Bacteroidota bacterium]
MERKTAVQAEDNRQEIHITREFDLPVDLVFKAYTTPELLEQWMGTKVIKLENFPHGSYRFVTTDPMGNDHGFNGTIHEFEMNQKITRTFEMENTPFTVQLEFLEFKPLSDQTSKLSIHSIFRSVEMRDQLLKMPFKQGINMAHNRLQSTLESLKK